MSTSERDMDSDTAVIGMSGRFPGAPDIDRFWENLKTGANTITYFSDQELRERGVNSAYLADPDYVKARPRLDGIDLFDAAFFGYPPREAEVMDPQHRVFLEMAWSALEHAGYVPDAFDGVIGVYAGSHMNTYIEHNLYPNYARVKDVFSSHFVHGTHNDYIATATAFKLNLTGPCVNVQSYCSTSLVAIHLATQSLLNFECDLALAGGVSVKVPQDNGYFFQRGGILSPDGVFRPFDIDAAGTIFGNGAGVVVLRRLVDALEEGDTIWAVIKGSAVNNDGANKASFTAPAVEGQAKVLRECLSVANLDPRDISYIETHGTGTEVGDLIELTALEKVYKTGGRRGFCALGSLKANIGHLEPASGVAGLIKTSLALHYRTLPASINCKTPLPKIDWANSPFAVNLETRPWLCNGPRLAGVSSFGVGGTNAHVILGEAPAREASAPNSHSRLILVSAKTEAALARSADQLQRFFEGRPDTHLADAAYTLALGRQAFNHRRFVVAETPAQAATKLGADLRATRVDRLDPALVLLFTGQGSQRAGMASELARESPFFLEQLQLCCRTFSPRLEVDLEYLLCEADASHSDQLKPTAIAQCALFSFQYALARWFMKLGFEPTAMLGHSLGEVVAATLAGVFTLVQAMQLVLRRGLLMQSMPVGTMLAVPLPERELKALLGPGLDLAAVNLPDQCVLSGTTEDIELLASQLILEGVTARRLETSHGFHSRMMEPAVAPFRDFVASFKLSVPEIPFISNLTGQWITTEQACSPDYWAQLLTAPVRFAQGLATLFEDPARVLLEIGPDSTLSNMARRHPDKPGHTAVIATFEQRGKTRLSHLHALGELWLQGYAVAWEELFEAERRYRIPLPTYPFERTRFWVDAPNHNAEAPQEGSDVEALVATYHDTAWKDNQARLEDWFFLPSWQRGLPPSEAATPATTLIFLDKGGFGHELAECLRQAGDQVFLVSLNEESDADFCLPTLDKAEMVRLFEGLEWRSRTEPRILFAPGLDPADPEQAYGWFERLLTLATVLGEIPILTRLEVLTRGMFSVGGEAIEPYTRLLAGPVLTIPPEYPHLRCRGIDLDPGSRNTPARRRAIKQILAEIATTTQEQFITYRGTFRYTRDYLRTRLQEPQCAGRAALKHGGTYLISGGMCPNHLGLAHLLVKNYQARVCLLVEPSFPLPELWDRLAPDSPFAHEVGWCRKIMGDQGSLLLLPVSAYTEMELAVSVRLLQERWGSIDGLFHGAYRRDSAPILGRDVRETGQTVRLLTDRLVQIVRATHHLPLDFIVLLSSNAAQTGEFGQLAFCTECAFLNGFAQWKQEREDLPVIALGWDFWDATEEATFVAEQWLETCAQLLPRALAYAPPELVISSQDYHTRLRHIGAYKQLRDMGALDALGSLSPAYARPALESDFVPPRDSLEEQLAVLWRNLTGIADIGVEDDFFELGGDSMSASRLVTVIARRFSVHLPVSALYQHTTIASLASLLRPPE